VDAKREARKVQASSFTDGRHSRMVVIHGWSSFTDECSGIEWQGLLKAAARVGNMPPHGVDGIKGFNMNSNDLDPENGSDEGSGPSRGSTHSVWSQRRQAKTRTRVRAKRRSSNVAATKGMHLRRNRRMSW
jgi:hypothetical protein